MSGAWLRSKRGRQPQDGAVVLWLALVAAGACSSEPPVSGAAVAAAPAPVTVAHAARCVALGAVDPFDPNDIARTCLFDDDAPPQSFTIRVAPADLAWLDAHALAEQYVPATLVYGGVEVAAEVRYKGSDSSLKACFDAQGNLVCARLSVKVRIAGGARFMGLRRFIFNAGVRDRSRLRERLAYRVFRDAGVIAPRAVHTMLTLGDRAPGLYLLVEDVDICFLNRNFSDATGVLTKEVWFSQRSTHAWQAGLQKDPGANVSRFLTFAQLLHDLMALTDTKFVARFNNETASWLDLDGLARFLVADMFTDNWDGARGRYCETMADGNAECSPHNFYIYDDPGSGQLRLIPWDLDLTFDVSDGDMGRSWWLDGAADCDPYLFREHSTMQRIQCDPVWRGLVRIGWPAYVKHLAVMAAPDGAVSAIRVHGHLDRYRAMIGPLMLQDRKSGVSMDAWEAETAELRSMVAAQAAQAQKLLLWPLPAAAKSWTSP